MEPINHEHVLIVVNLKTEHNSKTQMHRTNVCDINRTDE